MKRNKLKLDPYILILSLFCGMLIVVLDSLVDAYIFHEGTFLEQLFSPNLFEIYLRVLIFTIFIIFGIITSRIIYKLKLSDEYKSKIILVLQKTKEELKILEGILPICSFCKKIKNDKGDWNELESYFSKHSDAEFSS